MNSLFSGEVMTPSQTQTIFSQILQDFCPRHLHTSLPSDSNSIIPPSSDTKLRRLNRRIPTKIIIIRPILLR